MLKPSKTNSATEEEALKPMSSTVGDVTRLLRRWNPKLEQDREQLLDLVYPELKRIAVSRMRRERPNHTLQPTALVNEFVLQLCADESLTPRNRAHFIAIASRAMRRILVDHARAHAAEKRGGGQQRIELDQVSLPERNGFVDVLELNDLLERLAIEDPRMVKVIELRYFGGLSNAEVAETLGVGERTVKRDWQVGRAWLYAQLSRGKDKCGPENGMR
jgi:RNA polymerase sigma-70 factor (ECF subfamily)